MERDKFLYLLFSVSNFLEKKLILLNALMTLIFEIVSSTKLNKSPCKNISCPIFFRNDFVIKAITIPTIGK